MTQDEINERIEKIWEAIELVEAAQNLVDEAVKLTTQEGNYRAYGRYGFDRLLGNGNLCDSSLDDLRTRLREELTGTNNEEE